MDEEEFKTEADEVELNIFNPIKGGDEGSSDEPYDIKENQRKKRKKQRKANETPRKKPSTSIDIIKDGEKVKEDEAHRFQQVKSMLDIAIRNSVTLGYPVAMKPSATKEVKSWTTVIAEAEFEAVKPIEEQVFLRTSTSYEWHTAFHSFLQLPLSIYWQVFVILTIGYNYISSTYLFCFEGPLSGSNAHRPPYDLYFTDIIYLVDFVIALIHRYWKNLQNYINVKKRCRLALIVDTISLLLLDMIYSICTKNYLRSSVTFWLRSLTFLRLYRITNFFSEWADSAGSNHMWLFVTKYVTLLWLLLHTVACLWFSVGCIDECTGVKTWTVLLYRFSMTVATPGDWYFISLYFSLVSITNCGLGDIIATNDVERMICIVAMMVGFALTTGVYIGSLTSQMVNDGRRKALFTDQLQAIKMHLVGIKINPLATKSILKYYEVLWVKRRGVKTARDFKLLPLPLQMEVCFDINIGVFDNALLFQNKVESFLRKLSLLMTSTFHLPGEIIFHQNVAKYSMIYIQSGVLEILSDEDNESPMVSFTSGTVLGEISLVLTVPARATVRAATYTELQVLHKANFFRMMVNFPYTHRLIMREIFKRINMASTAGSTEQKTGVVLSQFVSQSKDKNPIKRVKDKLYSDQEKEKNRTDLKAEGFNGDQLKNNNFLSMYKITKNISQKEIPHMCLNNKCPFILEPGSQFVKFWRHLVFVVVVIVSFGYPYYIGFERGFPPWQVSFNFVYDFIYLMDIVILCTTAIEKGDQYTTKKMEILYCRMETFGFYFDVFSIFPIEVMAFLMDDLYMQDRMYSVFKLNRLLKAWRIPAYFKSLEKSLWANIIILRTCKYILYLLLISIWAGMLLYMVACFDIVCYENTWYDTMMEREIEMKDGNPCYANPNVMSVYYSISLLSGEGFGDVLPESILDIILCCFCILMGIVLFGYCIAEFSATCTQMERWRVEYQELVFAIRKFMSENRSIRIMDRVDKYFRLQWNYFKLFNHDITELFYI